MTNSNCLEGMKCPNCANEDAFKIEAKVLLYVTDEGSDIAENQPHEWEDSSLCYCTECNFSATVEGFKGGELKTEYESYFDECERANKIPLSFDEWTKKNA